MEGEKGGIVGGRGLGKEGLGKEEGEMDRVELRKW